jgi:hypothetical protein
MTKIKRQLSIVEEAESAVDAGLVRAGRLRHIVPFRGGSAEGRV